MCKTILVLLLVIVGSNAKAEWIAVNHNVYAAGYADPDTVVMHGNFAKIWVLVDCKMITRFIGGSPFKSIKSMEEFDCKEKKLRTLVYILHSGSMGKGEEIFRDSNPSMWTNAVPGSDMEDFLNIACAKM